MRHSSGCLRGKLGGCHLLMLLLKVFFPPALQSSAINAAPGQEEPRRCARGMGTVAGLDRAVPGVAQGTAVPMGLLAALGVEKAGGFCPVSCGWGGLGIERGPCIPPGCSGWSCTRDKGQ